MAYRETPKMTARLADNRRQLVKAARRLMAEGGFANVRVNTVADLCDMAPGNVYRYFPSKAHLLAEIVRIGSQREVAVIQGIAELPDAPSVRLAAAFRTFLIRALKERTRAYAVIAEPVDALVEKERLIYRREMAETIARIIVEGIESGELPEQDPQISAACITGGIIEALLSPLAPDRNATDEALEEFVTKTVAACSRTLGVNSLLEDILLEQEHQKRDENTLSEERVENRVAKLK